MRKSQYIHEWQLLYIIAGADGIVEYDWTTFQIKNIYEIPLDYTGQYDDNAEILGFEIVPSKKLLFIGSNTYNENVTIWDLETHSLIKTIDFPGRLWDFLVLEQNKKICVGGECPTPICLYDIETGKCIHQYEPNKDLREFIPYLKYSKQLNLIFAHNTSNIFCFDLDTFHLKWAFFSELEEIDASLFDGFLYSPNSNRFLCVLKKELIELDPTTGKKSQTIIKLSHFKWMDNFGENEIIYKIIENKSQRYKIINLNGYLIHDLASLIGSSEDYYIPELKLLLKPVYNQEYHYELWDLEKEVLISQIKVEKPTANKIIKFTY